jgi:ParB/RepB/Spo0J family partition protein
VAVMPQGENMMVDYKLIRPDPDQPRKTFSEESLKELADSIRQQGILQPLILEKEPAWVLHEPDLTTKDWRVSNSTGDMIAIGSEVECRKMISGRMETTYRIVCGERRWRAAGLAEWPELPSVVYTGLTAQQRFAMQFVENHQRENVNALEEAASMRRTLDARPGLTPEGLAAELGISRAAAYERLKLTRLTDPVRAALVSGKISTSVAGEVAKLPTPAAQKKLLEMITNEKSWQFPFSVRDVQEEIDNEYVKQLADAPFDTKSDGDNGCKHCPNRTGNMLAEFPELKARPNVCTNPICYADKCKTHWLAQAQDEAQKGTTVLTEQEFRKQKSKLVEGSKYTWEGSKSGTFEELMGKHKPQPVLVATDDGLKKYYPKEEAMAAARKNGVSFSRNATPAERAKEEAKRKAGEELKIKRRALASGMAADVAKALDGIKPNHILKFLTSIMVEPRVTGTLQGTVWKHVKTDGGKIAVVLLENTLRSVTDWETGAWDKDVLKLFKELGIDLVAEEKKAEPALVLPAADGKQKELLPVKAGKRRPKCSAATKALILENQKARWAKLKAA